MGCAAIMDAVKRQIFFVPARNRTLLLRSSSPETSHNIDLQLAVPKNFTQTHKFRLLEIVNNIPVTLPCTELSNDRSFLQIMRS